MQLLIHLAFEQAPAYCSGAWIMMCLLWNGYSTMKSVCFLTSSRRKTNWLTRIYPALDADCMFSRAWRRLHVFPRLALAACFPRLALASCFRLHVLYIELWLLIVWLLRCKQFCFSFVNFKTQLFLFLLLYMRSYRVGKSVWLVLLSTAIGLFLVVVITFIWICIKRR